MKIPVRGLTFDVATGGPVGGDPVLLLHGFPQNATMWSRITPSLHAAGRATIAPDQRGYSPGARPLDPDAYAIDECVADALAILDALDVERVDVVGHDWGAIVGWHLAAKHAERVKTFTAVSVPHPVAFGHAIATDDDQAERSAYMKFFRKTGRAEDVLLEDHGVRMRAIFSGCPETLIDDYVRPMLDREALTGALNWYRAMTSESLTCGPVSVPTTFVWGDADIAVGPVAARTCSEHVDGDFRFVTLDGIGHWVVDAAPEPLTMEILARMT